MKEDINKPTAEQLKKLPEWARRYIHRTERELERAIKACDDKGKSPIFSTFVDGWREPSGFVQSDRVYFQTQNRKLTNYTFEVRLENDSLEVRCRDGALVIMPGCSNVVTIREAK